MMDIAVALRAFVRTVERGSVTAAARDLGVTQPAVTKHLRNLEDRLGARLIDRSSRVVRPTPQGQTLYETSRDALATIDNALEGVRRDMGAVEGHLRLHAPLCLSSDRLTPIVLDFQERHPSVSIDVILENRDVDLLYENYDLAVLHGRPASQDLIIRKIGLIRRIIVAAPSFLEKTGPIDTLERLSEVSLIITASSQSPRDTLTLQRRDGEVISLGVCPLMRTNNGDVFVAALVRGRAAGPIQEFRVKNELAEGNLVRILPEYEIKPTEAFLAYPSARFMRPVVRAFADFAIPALRTIHGGSEDLEPVRSTG